MTPRRMIMAILVLGPLLVGHGMCLSTIRRALIIGNDSYPGNSLRNARNDAKAMFQELQSLGYVATLRLDVNSVQLRSAVDQFSASVQPGDTALVYYAGHGLQVSGENYLIPVDYRLVSEEQVAYQAYGLGAILSNLTLHRASTQIVILDACRDNPFSTSRSSRTGWSDQTTSAGQFLAFGTAPGFTAGDGPNIQHGVFTQALLQHLRGSADIDQMFTEVRQDVLKATQGAQVPWVSSSLIGTFHLNPLGDVTAPTLASAFLPGVGMTEQASRSLDTSGVSPGWRQGAPLALKEEERLLNTAAEESRQLHFTEAITVLEEVLSLDPRCALALRALGVLYHLVERHAESQHALDRALLLDPQDGVALSYRCIIGLQADGQATARDCDSALVTRKDLPQVHIGRSFSLAAHGDNELAVMEATTAVSLDPGSASSYAARGQVATSGKQYAQARQDFETANNLIIEQGARH